MKRLSLLSTAVLAVVFALPAHAGGKKHPAAPQESTSSTPTPKANPRYVIKDGEVYDKKTDLTWQRCSVGQHWKGDVGCVGIAKHFTFDDAQKQAGNGWRVPTFEELETLLNDEVAFPDLPPNTIYWSSTVADASNAWFVAMSGEVGKFTTWHTYYVRLVRDGQ